MRNYVAKHDHNRASVHTDKKKDNRPDVGEGLDEHHECLLSLDPSEIAVAEYTRGVKDSRIV